MANAALFSPIQGKGTVYGASFQGAAKQTVDRERRNGTLSAVQAPDALMQRQALAKKQARKIVGDAFAGEKKVDDNVRGLRDQVGDLRAENLEKGDRAAELNRLIEEARALHGDDAEAFEAHVKDYREQLDSLEKEMSDNDAQIKANNAAVTAIGLERLKSDPMGEAQDAADGMLDAANKELAAGLFAEAKEHIDEEREKTEEAAEKRAEEASEKQERIDAAKEKREERKEQTETVRERAPMPNMAKVQETQDQVKEKVDEMLDKLKLLSEDIKGVTVDDLL